MQLHLSTAARFMSTASKARSFQPLRTLPLLLIITHLLFPFQTSAQTTLDKLKLSENEKEAWFLEMVEFDATLREISSFISHEEKKMIIARLKVFQESNVELSPYYRHEIIGVMKKLKSKDLYQYYTRMMKSSGEIISILENENEERPVDWNKVIEKYGEIINSCRECHQVMKEEQQ